MEFTALQNLPCLGLEDYAAYATYMKCLAEQLEDSFTEKNTALDAVRNSYAGVWRNTVAITSTGPTPFPGTEAVSNLFWNDPLNAPNVGSGTTDDPYRYQFPGMISGALYHIGGTVFFNQGATNGSSRELQFVAYYSTNSGVVTRIKSAEATEERLSGGEALTTSFQLGLSFSQTSPFSATFGTPLGFALELREGDAGNITVPVGGLTFWCILIGTNTLIGGV